MTTLKDAWGAMRWPFKVVVVLVAPLVPLTLWWGVEAANHAIVHAIGPDGTFVLLLYFLPTVLAFMRSARNFGSVLFINLLLGWTVIGWWIALGLAGSGSATRKEAA